MVIHDFTNARIQERILKYVYPLDQNIRNGMVKIMKNLSYTSKRFESPDFKHGAKGNT